uniref:Uncharacterized protein n=1 Tax=Helianthus annuus TaxID=4232 RepID=A0A251U9R1_HELAN
MMIEVGSDRQTESRCKVHQQLATLRIIVNPSLRFTQKNMKICWVRLLGNRFGSELMPLMLLETPLLLLKDPRPKTLTTACLLERRLRFCSDGRDRKATRCVNGSQSEW